MSSIGIFLDGVSLLNLGMTRTKWTAILTTVMSLSLMAPVILYMPSSAEREIRASGLRLRLASIYINQGVQLGRPDFLALDFFHQIARNQMIAMFERFLVRPLISMR